MIDLVLTFIALFASLIAALGFTAARQSQRHAREAIAAAQAAEARAQLQETIARNRAATQDAARQEWRQIEENLQQGSRDQFNQL